MKQLVIVRHAKAEQGGYDHDFGRELAPKGVGDAHRMGAELKERNIIPDFIIASPASRALSTATIFAQELNFPTDQIVRNKSLYFDYTTDDFIDIIKEVPDEVNSLFVFGHNPFIFFMAENLCSKFHNDMPTCSTVVINFKIDSWKMIEPRQGNLFVHLYPGIFKH